MNEIKLIEERKSNLGTLLIYSVPDITTYTIRIKRSLCQGSIEKPEEDSTDAWFNS